MKEIAWKFVAENLNEARGEVEDLVARAEFAAFGKVYDEHLKYREESIARRARKCPLSEGSLSVSFDHAYHHLNFAWNCRHADDERIRQCEWPDFIRWSRFPRAGVFRGLAPGVQDDGGAGSGRINPKAMHPFLQLAMRKLAILCFLVQHHHGNGTWQAPKGLSPDVLEAPFGEKEFARRLRGVYEMLEAAWEHRKGGRKGKSFSTKEQKGAGEESGVRS